MRREISECADAARRFLSEGAEAVTAAGAALREKDPLFFVTIARGSSDHAASFLKYAIELTSGLPVASLGPSLGSIYKRDLRLGRAAGIAISQSGGSPDIVAMTEAVRRGGALTIALTNTPGSPMTKKADHTLDIAAGVEKSVAATKTFVNSVVAGLALLAAWRQDDDLRKALETLPDALAKAVDCDWSALVTALDGHQSLYVLGRGPSAAIAAEAALKFKETCSIHAESYSAAEVLHGPARIVEGGYPILALAARDAAEDSVVAIAEQLAGQGGVAFVTSEHARAAHRLPFAPSGHPLTDALVLVVSFYRFIEALSRHRGFDPDRPPFLNKLTLTR
ncbi:SIS domain-containing protein [Arsenicitalea aurantiaca]|uniref:SIS domain-containing protein n=2 Tax=Arsenicitalea aurantiaca TaxID=1783274 RepID=A0A433XGI5_9HYPH|nr:SIS domain-containing protein [Arsenicitalea aurantiaca]